MAPPLVDHSTGDIINADHVNDIKNYLEDGTYRVNTLSLSIGGTEVISAARRFIPGDIRNPNSSGLNFYASDGVTLIMLLDENGNLYLKGSLGSL